MTREEHSDDVISRQAAIDAVSDCGICIQKIVDLPSVQPKTGHWIEGRTNDPKIHNILCSCCFEGYPSRGHANSQHTRERFKYCPNCGAKMEVE